MTTSWPESWRHPSARSILTDVAEKKTPERKLPPVTPAKITDAGAKQEVLTRATTAVKTTARLDFVRSVRGR